jgi:hypothetical protein
VRRFSARLDGFGLGGQGGTRAGGSIDARTHLVYDRLALDTRGFVLYYRDDIVEDRRGYSVALQAGGNVRLANGVYLNLVAEELVSSFYRTAFRALGTLSVDWNFRGGRR